MSFSALALIVWVSLFLSSQFHEQFTNITHARKVAMATDAVVIVRLTRREPKTLMYGFALFQNI